MRRSDNRAPFLHKRNVTRYNPRKNYDKTCRCFICNSPDHLSKTRPNKGQKRYSSKYEEQERVLIVDSVNENILICDDEIEDDESIYSIIETDDVENEELENSSSEEEVDLIEELAGLKIEMMNQVELKHEEQLLPNRITLLAFEDDQKEDKINISLGSKYIVKIPIKDMLGIRIPIIINLKPNLSYQLLALLDTGCTKNIIHSKYFERCPELISTIEDDKAEVSIDMSGIKFINNQMAYNINSYINGAKYVIDEVTIRDLSLINDDMIISLRFLQYSTKGLIVTKQGIAFIPHNEDMPYATKINKNLNMQSKWDPSTSHDTSKQNISTPYEFLTPKISFKTEQILSCFTQDIKDLIWKNILNGNTTNLRISKNIL